MSDVWPEKKRASLVITINLSEKTAGGATASAQLNYGIRRGIPKILKILDENRLKATFFVSKDFFVKYRNIIAEIYSRGHEIALLIDKKLKDAENEIKVSVRTFLEEKYKPLGIRILKREELTNYMIIAANIGILYDSSLPSNDFPHVIDELGIIEIPYFEYLVDINVFDKKLKTPAEAYELLLSELDSAYEEGSLLTLVFHPSCIARPPRLRVLNDLLIQAQRYKGLWIARAAKVAEWIRERTKSEFR
ncbi:MAG: polysaccharide deacetylase family protein [Candidatus Baldrarchaeia archaeon]